MKKNKLYTANRFNQPLFAQDVDRVHHNIFDGEGSSFLNWDKLASSEFGANYGDAGFELSDYMNSTNAFGISKIDNPFSKGNIAGGLGAMLNTPIGGALAGGLADVVGQFGGKAIAGGLSSKAGDAIGTFGSMAGNAISAANPLIGSAISLGSGLVGGLTNRMFGTKVNEAKLNAANEGTAAYNSFQSNASGFDGVTGPVAQERVQDVYKGGWFSSGKTRRKNEALKAARREAKQLAFRAVDNNVHNLVDDQMNNALANYNAFGGFLGDNDMSAVNYDLMSDYLTIKKKQAEQKNKMNNLFAGMPSGLFAFGGDMQTHGGRYSVGQTYNVSEEEANRLKAMGYEFRIIG